MASLSLTSSRSGELDLVLIRSNGITIIEVKSTNSTKNVANCVRKAIAQTQRRFLKALFCALAQFAYKKTAASAEDLWDRICIGDYVCVVDNTYEPLRSYSIPASELFASSLKPLHIESDANGETRIIGLECATSRNLYSNLPTEDYAVFQAFVVLLCAHREENLRPHFDEIIATSRTISTHDISYREGSRVKRHNDGVSANSILEKHGFKPLIWPLKCDDLYLTSDQVRVLFNEHGRPIRQQVLIGPPGSGKSVLLLIKMAIASQDYARQHIKAYCFCSTKYIDTMMTFQDLNSKTFKRRFWPLKTMNKNSKRKEVTAGAFDVVIDEEDGVAESLQWFSKDPDQYVAIVNNKWQLGHEKRAYIEQQCNNAPVPIPVFLLDTSFRYTQPIFDAIMRLAKLDPELEEVCRMTKIGHSLSGDEVRPSICKNIETMIEKTSDRLLEFDKQNKTGDKVAAIIYDDETLRKHLHSLEIKHDVEIYHQSMTPSMQFPILISLHANAARKTGYCAYSRAMTELIVLELESTIVRFDSGQKTVIMRL